MIQTRNQETQVEPEAKPTKVYIDRSCSAKQLSIRVMKQKPAPTVDVGCNTDEIKPVKIQSPSRGSEPSSINTPSNAISENNNKTKLFRKYNSIKFNSINASGGIGNRSYNPDSINTSMNIKKHTSHSIDLENQLVLQQKYTDSLQNYPNTRTTPHVYESVERPNSVTGNIKIRKSHDFSNFAIKNTNLDMYQNTKGSKQKLSSSRYSNHSSSRYIY